MRTVRGVSCLAVMTLLLWTSAALAKINPRFTPVQLTKQAALILVVDLKQGASNTNYVMAVREVLKGKMEQKTIPLKLGLARDEQTAEMLRKLAANAQVLVVTHSPQVAARARHHWLISKDQDDDVTRTSVRALNQRTVEGDGGSVGEGLSYAGREALHESIRSLPPRQREALLLGSLCGVSDDELVGLALGGDRAAFGELVERHQQAVFLTALGALRSREEAEDVTQDTFIRAFGALARFRGDASFKTWVLTDRKSVV
jgi:DNA-directed RNA polymerase specialized sigma24 family protein